ncbi:MAG: putative monovalent cation/H+ antiporter subunit A [Melioribacteraceae bacterium]|nr:putative monovalent cation/H+ antiporter subunit A [Melioribacteraceae bacterium]
MLFFVLLGFITAVLVPLIKKISDNFLSWIIPIIPASIFFYFASFYYKIADGEVIKVSYSWIPSLGINFDFYIDGLSLVFAMIISLVGTVVYLYAGSYLKGDARLSKFYIYISIFMSSMIGVVTSDNLMTLFIFWELTSISSYLLIGFNHEKESSRYSALQALLVTGLGGLALLAGFILLYITTGTWDISEINKLPAEVIGSSYFLLIVIFILLGTFTKSAQFPFHFWLPNAMEAPTPVSAYLHSATMVKAGIYLMARLNPAFGNSILWNDLLLIFGTATMLFAAVLSFKQTDLKKLLAYSTLSVLGTLTMLIGIGSDLAIKAFIIYLIAHSLYKGTLFLIAGIIDHETGTRNIEKLSGLRKLMPITMFIAVAASLSKMGIIPLVGFVGKETVYASVLELPTFGNYLIIITILANMFVVYITAMVGFRPFFGKLKSTPKNPHEAPFRMWSGPLLLALSGLVLGIFSSLFLNKLINSSELGIISERLNIPVKLWHGFNLELLLSTITVLLGLFLYFKRDYFLKFVASFSSVKFVQPSYYYQFIFDGTLSFAKYITAKIQNGYLRFYILIILLTTFSLIAYTLHTFYSFKEISIGGSVSIYEVILAFILIISTLLAVSAKSRLAAIVGLGGVGYVIALFFLVYSAPDLAMTQFSIETLTVILFVLVIYKLPKYLSFSSTTRRIRDIIVASFAGLTMFFLVLVISGTSLTSELKEYFIAESYPSGKGLNVVNVILVDFRALDTLGEITVLAVAAIGVYSLLKLRKKDN